MKSLIQKSTVVFGASMFTFAQANVHAHVRAKVHDVIRPLDMLNVKRDAAMLETRGKDEDYYSGKKHESGGGGGKGGKGGKDGKDGKGGSYEYEEYGSHNSDSGYGDGYGDQNSDDSTTTIIINVTEEGSYGMGEETSIYNSYHDVQTSIQLSLITTTIYESSPPQIVTVTSMAEPVTQTEMVTITMADVKTEMVTVTEADTQTEMVTITQADIQTQMVTITEPGTCSTTGLATADVGAISQSYALTTASYYAAPSDSSILTAAAPSITYAPVGSSGQVAQGTGVYNGAGLCECACACAADSFPTYVYAAMAASPTAAAPTTMQTVVSAAAGESAVYSNSYAAGTTSGYSNTTSSYAAATISSSSSSDSSSDSSSTSSINVVFTLNSYTSSTYTTSSSPESTTSSYSSSDTSATETSTSASAQADLASDPTYTTPSPSQAAASGFAINLSTLSLTSELILGNLATQAAPTA